MSEVKNPILGYAESYRTMIRVAIADQTPTDVSMYSVAVDIERNMAPLWDAQRLRADTAEAELMAAKDKYQRDVYGLNNEGDPIGGDPAGGYINDLLTLRLKLAHVLELLKDAASYTRHPAYDWDQSFAIEVDAALSTASPATISQQGEEA